MTQDKHIDPVKRAQQIRDYVARKKIKSTGIIDETLALLDGMAVQEKQEDKKTA